MWLQFILIIPIALATTVQYRNILNYKCNANVDCTRVLSNSICLNKRCVCQYGYAPAKCLPYKYGIRSRRENTYAGKMLGEECQSTNQCRRTPKDETKVCSKNKCQCSYGHISVDAFRCIRDYELLPLRTRVTKSYEREPPGYGSVCSTNNECQNVVLQLECVHGACVCLEGYVPLGKYICYNTRREESTQVSTVSTTKSMDYPINNEVIRSLGKIGNTCVNDYFCRRTVSQSHCYNGKCTCFDGYVSVDQYTCVKKIDTEPTTKSMLMPVAYKSLLGGKCSTNRNCHTSNAVCLNLICSCPTGYFPVDDWTCLQETESSDEEVTETPSDITNSRTTTTTTALLSSTTFRWWPWSPTPVTRPIPSMSENTFLARCILNRQCASMDKNSHCTVLGRCACNRGFRLTRTNVGEQCIPRLINEDDCD